MITIPESNRFDVSLTLLTALAGATAVFLLRNYPLTSPYAFGPHTLPMFVPLVLAVGVVGVWSWRGNLGLRHLLLALVVFGAATTPMLGILDQQLIMDPADDGYRYITYATNMLANSTLWGSDALIYPGQHHYVDQPGYRYLLAAVMAVTHDPTRATQMLLLTLYLIVTLAFLWTVQEHIPGKFYRSMVAFLVCCSPYVAKNTLMILTETSVVMLLMLSTILLCHRKKLPALIMIALLPFIRQNLYPAAGILVLYLLAITHTNKRQTKINFCITMMVFLLPVFHNLYYAEELRLLTTNRGTQTWLQTGNLQEAIRVISGKLIHYLGYSHEATKFTSVVIGAIFTPLATLLVGYHTWKLSGSARWITALLFLLAVLPTFAFGRTYFPRYEYVNLSFGLFTLCLVHIVQNHRGTAALPFGWK